MRVDPVDSCSPESKCDPDVGRWCHKHARERAEYMALAELERIANATRRGSELIAYKTALDDVRAIIARSVQHLDDTWINSLERDIEAVDGQLALASILPNDGTIYIHVEAKRLKRLVEAVKSTLREETG